MPEVIRVEELSHIYSPNTPFEKRALDSVSFRADEGEFIALIGHTGSGKSTFIQHLNGLLRPSGGRVFIGGRDIWERPREIRGVRFQVGLVFQYPEYQLFEETVYEDIAFGPKNMGMSDVEVRCQVEAAAHFVGLESELFTRSPFELSGGQKRKAAVAGVMAMEPSVLILDEPTAGLDPKSRRELLDRISEYRRARGITVIIVTHSMEDAARVAGRIVVMERGRITDDGTPSEIFSRADKLVSAGLGVPQITRIMRRLRECGVGVDPSVYTVEQAVEEILRVKGETPVA